MKSPFRGARPAVVRPRRETPEAAFGEESRCELAVHTLALLANAKRLRILCALADRELSVAQIVDVVGGGISGVSQQLKLLMLAGHLKRRRSQKSVYYRLTDPRVRRILHFLRDQFPSP